LVDDLEYHFKTLELNILNGMIGEHLARSFIRNTLAPKLVKEEGWNHVLLSKNDYKQHKKSWMKTLFKFDAFRDDFVARGFYANRKLLSRYAQVAGVLVENHCTPDGLLMKLRLTGKTRKLMKSECPKVAGLRLDASHRCGDILEFPVVGGNLEVVEIKCGRKAKLMDKQKKTYNDLIAKGIPLRMIKVRIVSFDLNRFLVEEHKYERFL
jgi:hypothetical protein